MTHPSGYVVWIIGYLRPKQGKEVSYDSPLTISSKGILEDNGGQVLEGSGVAEPEKTISALREVVIPSAQRKFQLFDGTEICLFHLCAYLSTV